MNPAADAGNGGVRHSRRSQVTDGFEASLNREVVEHERDSLTDRERCTRGSGFHLQVTSAVEDDVPGDDDFGRDGDRLRSRAIEGVWASAFFDGVENTAFRAGEGRARGSFTTTKGKKPDQGADARESKSTGSHHDTSGNYRTLRRRRGQFQSVKLHVTQAGGMSLSPRPPAR